MKIPKKYSSIFKKSNGTYFPKIRRHISKNITNSISEDLHLYGERMIAAPIANNLDSLWTMIDFPLKNYDNRTRH